MDKETKEAQRNALIQLFEDLDDIRQFYFGNLKALVEKSDSVDKRLFEQNRARLKLVTQKVAELATGIAYSDPMDAVNHLRELDVMPDTPKRISNLTLRDLKALIAPWPVVDREGKEIQVRLGGPDNLAMPVTQIKTINDGHLWLRSD